MKAFSPKDNEVKQAKRERFSRILRWIFFKSGIISLAFEHFLAMIPATILVPVLVNNAFDVMVIDMSLVLLTSGIGTFIFAVLTKGKIPAYLGSSFAYIGLTIYLIQEQMSAGASHTMAYAYVGWAYVFSGIILFLLSYLYLKKGIERILSFFMPATVVGPAISLIGLELADTAIVDSGFDIEDGLVDPNAAIVAMATLAVIVFASLLKPKFFKNAAIIVGMVVGCVISFALNGLPEGYLENVEWSALPNVALPIVPPDISTLVALFVAVLPATFIVFTENIGRFTVISRMTREETTDKEAIARDFDESGEVIDDDTGENDLFTENSVKGMCSSIRAHGLATVVAGLMGSVPNTIYAENIAVMSIHRRDTKRDEDDEFIKKLTSPISVAPYIIASLLAMLFAFSGYLQAFLLNIPKAVIGGMELFLFGIISAPGIQLLVEQRVNYKKISNQIITAAVLISGISGLSINIWSVELKGMGLGFVVGVVINIIVRGIKWFGHISDVMTFDEMVYEILSVFNKDTAYRIIGYRRIGQSTVDYQRNCNISGFVYALKGRDCRVRMPDGSLISDDTIRDEMRHSDILEVGIGGVGTTDAIMRFKKTTNGLSLEIKASAVSESKRKQYLNDYEAIDEDGDLLIVKVAEMPMRHVCSLVRHIDKIIEPSDSVKK